MVPETNMVLVQSHPKKPQTTEIYNMLRDMWSLLITSLVTAIVASTCIVVFTLLISW